MVDLTTEYLGIKLNNPLVPSASPLSRDRDMAKQLEDAGAAALVMYSLFEEKIEHEHEHMMRFVENQAIGHPEADSFHPSPITYRSYQDEYLEQLQHLKSELSIPIIASLNGISLGGWVEYGKQLQQAGADALELNVYYIAADVHETGQQVEDRYVEILQALRQQVSVPITLKLSSQFSSLTNVVQRFNHAGAAGVALFNRFYQPDIDLATLKVTPTLNLSTSQESLLRIRWIAMLYGRVKCSLAVTGGLHTHTDVLKALLAGADVTHLCSTLLQHGPSRLSEILQHLSNWMEEREYTSIQQLKGSVSQQHALDPVAFERTNYMNVLDSYTHPRGVMR